MIKRENFNVTRLKMEIICQFRKCNYFQIVDKSAKFRGKLRILRYYDEQYFEHLKGDVKTHVFVEIK